VVHNAGLMVHNPASPGEIAAREAPVTDHEKIQQLLRIKEQAPIRFDQSASALIVVDVQRYFARPDYAFGEVLDRLVPGLAAGYFDRVQNTVLGNIARLQAAFRAQGQPVIFVGAGCYLPDGRDLPEWLRDFDELARSVIGRRVCPIVTDPSWQIDDSVAPLPGEIVLNKTSSGPLNSTKLDQTLHNLGVNSLVVCGLTTAVCVTQTARELADRSFRVSVANDACTEMSVEMHDAALLAFGYVFGRVHSTDDIATKMTTATAHLTS
jgi:nicotinamidase-related amidase